MSRERKVLQMQKGDLTRKVMIEREQEEQSVTLPSDQLKTPPAWLTDPVARREWKRITKELAKIQIVGNLDRDNIAGYCNALSVYIGTVKAMAGKELDEQLVYMNAQCKAADEVRKFGRLCGLTIDSRLKAAAIKTKEMNDAIEKEFGVI